MPALTGAYTRLHVFGTPSRAFGSFVGKGAAEVGAAFSIPYHPVHPYHPVSGV